MRPGYIAMLIAGLSVAGIGGAVITGLIKETSRETCSDTIRFISKGDTVSGSPCAPGTSMHYLRDINGSRYVVCTCPGREPPSRGTVDITPFLLDAPTDGTDEDIAAEPEDEGWVEL